MSQLELFEQPRASEHPPVAIDGFRYFTGFVCGDEQAALLREIDAHTWLDDLPRRVQHYGYRYDYRSRRVTRDMALGELPTFLRALSLRLCTEGSFRSPPDQAIVNEYLPGQGISRHVDCVPCFGDTIASISLGSRCEMEFQRGDEVRLQILDEGSLLILAGHARYAWTHAIRPRRDDHGRSRGVACPSPFGP